MTPQAEQLKKSKMFTLAGIILLVITLILCVLPLFFAPRQKGEIVKITVNGKSEFYSLSIDRTFVIDGAVIKIENKQVYFESNDCPTKQCVHSGKISKVGQSALCSPKKIYVEIVGNSFDGSTK